MFWVAEDFKKYDVYPVIVNLFRETTHKVAQGSDSFAPHQRNENDEFAHVMKMRSCSMSGA